ncbi:MAG TPA: FAD-dependent oxidoreductase [Bdellovibrionota bacterium]|nr:FAD-dependent oxidoreductase [Bdellovibrionota bacterium]
MAKKIAIFGAGMTGLAAGRMLVQAGHEVDVYEASDQIGGLAKTYRDSDGFVYDNGPRFIFSTLAEKIGIAHLCQPVKYYEDLYVGGRYYLFPFGFIRNPVYCASAGLATLTRLFHRKPQNLGEFLQTYYGRIFSSDVLKPLISKWAGIPTEEVSIDFASRLLPTNIGYVIHSLVKKLRGGVTEDYYKAGRYIVYPRGSNAVIFESLASTPGLRVHLRSPLEKLKTSGDRIQGAVVDQTPIEADYYLSTIPINTLPRLLDRPNSIAHWSQFHYRAIMILFIKLRRERVLNHLWTWFPEPKYRFYRISEFKNALKDLSPADKTLIAVEFACEHDDPLWAADARKAYREIEMDLHDLYGIGNGDVLGLDLRKSGYAYPVLRKSTELEQRAITHQTPFVNLFVAGRTGMFQYRMLEGCFESAMTCVARIHATVEGQTELSLPELIRRDAFGRPTIVPE